MDQKISDKLKEEPNNKLYIFSIIVILSIMLIWSLTAINTSGNKGKGLEVARNIILGILNPRRELLFDLTKSGVLYMILETICIAFLGTIVGALISIPISFLASTKIVPYPVSYFVRVLVMLVRTIPSLVYGLIFIRITGPGPFAGLLTMSLTSVGMLTKLFSETINDLDKNILESFTAMGFTRIQKIRYGILPQLIPNFLSTVIYRFDMNLRDATVLGLVGAGGIGSPLIFAMSSYRWNEVGAILLGLITLVLIVEFISSKIRAKLV